jgi:hypothetical protein
MGERQVLPIQINRMDVSAMVGLYLRHTPTRSEFRVGGSGLFFE